MAQAFTLFADWKNGRGSGKDYGDRESALEAFDQVRANRDVARVWVRAYSDDGDDPQTIADSFIERYQGLVIWQSGDGFCACNGPDYAADNEETLDDAKRAIERYWSGDEHGPLNGFFTGADA